MKALVVVGTRPEAIKLAPVIVALGDAARVVTTGQHAELAGAALGDFGLVPDVALPPPVGERSLSRLAGHVLEAIDDVIVRERPDWVIVQGDTTSALAAGLAGFHRQVRVAHVEAGLRTGDMASPFPEEGNRAMLARIATLSLAPTEWARNNLLAEGIAASSILVTGNTVVDAVALAQRQWTPERRQAMGETLALEGRRLVLVTCHRRENFSALGAICSGVRALAEGHPDHLFVLPVHPNPDVRGVVERELGGIVNVRVVQPLGYHETLFALSSCELVLTDSGGLQEEVAAFQRPAVVLREHTERPEGIEAGFAVLAGRDPERIIAAAEAWLGDAARRDGLKRLANPYGDGRAAERIVSALKGVAA